MNKFIYTYWQNKVIIFVNQQSNKQPLSIIYFIQSDKNLVIILIWGNKHFFVCYYDQFGNPPHALYDLYSGFERNNRKCIF